jgi:hypothetical protein
MQHAGIASGLTGRQTASDLRPNAGPAQHRGPSHGRDGSATLVLRGGSLNAWPKSWQAHREPEAARCGCEQVEQQKDLVCLLCERQTSAVARAKPWARWKRNPRRFASLSGRPKSWQGQRERDAERCDCEWADRLTDCVRPLYERHTRTEPQTVPWARWLRNPSARCLGRRSAQELAGTQRAGCSSLRLRAG